MSVANDGDSVTSTAVLEHLAALGVAYEIVECDPDLADTAQFCERYGFSMDASANAICVVGKSADRPMACCLVLATTRLDVNGVVRRRLGTRKASFADADETIERTGMMIGGVTPFGLPSDLPVWIDSRVMACEQVIVGGGSRDCKILCPPSSLMAIASAHVVDDLAKNPPNPPAG
ncbi:YbaK/EbsC family protein [Candidatus Poriferisodalis sp.]|uniref:YbaK/EbsC family protein n=1 Tax=Candidatus Poriferisodalis sp. TaxID=3101277 RepID=UPI003D0CEB20